MIKIPFFIFFGQESFKLKFFWNTNGVAPFFAVLAEVFICGAPGLLFGALWVLKGGRPFHYLSFQLKYILLDT